MAEGQRIEKEGLPYSEALKIMGFPKGSRPNDQDIIRRLKALAKKYHPDLFARASKEIQKQKTQQFQLINEAARRLRDKEILDKSYLTPGYEKYLNQLIAKIPVSYDTEQMAIILADETKRISKTKSPGEEDKFRDAVKVFEKIRERQRFMQDLIQGKVKSYYSRAARRALMSDEDREIDYLVRKARAMSIKQLFDQWLDAIPSLMKRVVYIGRKPRVPIKVRRRGQRPIKKYIVLTAGLMVAILGGKYIWDKQYQAYYRKKKALMVV